MFSNIIVQFFVENMTHSIFHNQIVCGLKRQKRSTFMLEPFRNKHNLALIIVKISLVRMIGHISSKIAVMELSQDFIFVLECTLKVCP